MLEFPVALYTNSLPFPPPQPCTLAAPRPPHDAQLAAILSLLTREENISFLGATLSKTPAVPFTASVHAP